MSRELQAQLAAIRSEAAQLLAGLDDGEYAHGSLEVWGPAQHLDHLTRSNAPVAAALRVPERLPSVPEGQGPRSAEEIAALYRAALTGGARASGRYLPEVSGSRAEQQAAHLAALDALQAGLSGWNEAALDRLGLPHPVLGLLSVREMLHFTVIHNRHHHAGIQSGLARREQA